MGKGTKITCKKRVKSAEEMLKARGLNKRGAVQREFSNLMAKYMDNYVPYNDGGLKDDSIHIEDDYVEYDCAYARKQYYTNTGTSKRNRTGKRAKFWDKRAWSEKGKLVLLELNKFLRGLAK